MVECCRYANETKDFTEALQDSIWRDSQQMVGWRYGGREAW